MISGVNSSAGVCVYTQTTHVSIIIHPKSQSNSHWTKVN